MRPKLHAIADHLRRSAQEAKERGEVQSALAFYEAVVMLDADTDPAGARELLSEVESSGNLQEMTGAQLQRRGKAIAKAKAAKSDDRLWAAIVASKWGSQEVYAKRRLGVSPGSLSAYRSGNTPCPRPVAVKVLADFKIGDDYWPGGVVE